MATTARVSRVLYNTIAKRAEPGESKDMTLRRLLLGEREPRKASSDSPRTVIKLSRTLRGHVRQCALAKESVDHTIRRLLQVEPCSE